MHQASAEAQAMGHRREVLEKGVPESMQLEQPLRVGADPSSRRGLGPWPWAEADEEPVRLRTRHTSASSWRPGEAEGEEPSAPRLSFSGPLPVSRCEEGVSERGSASVESEVGEGEREFGTLMQKLELLKVKREQAAQHCEQFAEIMETWVAERSARRELLQTQRQSGPIPFEGSKATSMSPRQRWLFLHGRDARNKPPRPLAATRSLDARRPFSANDPELSPRAKGQVVSHASLGGVPVLRAHSSSGCGALPAPVSHGSLGNEQRHVAAAPQRRASSNGDLGNWVASRPSVRGDTPQGGGLPIAGLGGSPFLNSDVYSPTASPAALPASAAPKPRPLGRHIRQRSIALGEVRRLRGLRQDAAYLAPSGHEGPTQGLRISELTPGPSSLCGKDHE